MRIPVMLMVCMITANLWADPTPQVRIVTRPAGATVFVDGVERGKTPLNISTSDKAANVRLSMNGFEEIRFPLRASGDLEIELTLVAEDSQRTQPSPGIVPASKNARPYTGAFARSLLIPGWGQYSKKDSSAIWFLAGTLVSGIAYLDASQSFMRMRKDAIIKYREGDVYSVLQAGLVPGAKARETAATQALGIALLHIPSGNERQFTHNCFAISPVNLTNGTMQTCRNNRRALARKYSTGFVFAGMYLWNAFDALLATERMSLSIGFPEEGRGVVMAASLRF